MMMMMIHPPLSLSLSLSLCLFVLKNLQHNVVLAMAGCLLQTLYRLHKCC